jgi:hypothetical protein
MPSVPRKSKGKYVEIEDSIRERFEALAVRNGRPFKAELEHAMLRHLDSPPAMVTPAMPRATAGVEVEEPARKRGRPRKSPPA